MTVDLIYIAGFGRSGSTLLEAHLRQHFDVLGLGEVFFVWERGVIANETVGDGIAFDRNPFWQGLLAECFGPIDPARARAHAHAIGRLRGERPRPGGLRAQLPQDPGVSAAALRPLYAGLQDRAAGRVLIDGSKYPLYAAALATFLHLRIGVIHMYRDPRAVTHAWMRAKLRPEGGPGAMMARSRTALGPAWRWLWLNRQAEALETELGLPRVLIGYERFCDAPELYLDLVARRFGLGPRRLPDMGWPSVSGNPARLAGTLDRIACDMGWTGAMHPVHRGLARGLCGRAHARLCAQDAAQFRAAA